MSFETRYKAFSVPSPPRLAASYGLLVLAIIGLIMGCGPKQPDGRTIVHRFIDVEAPRYFERTDVLELVVQETWSFASQDDLKPWRQEMFDLRFEQRRLNLVMLSSKRRPRLLRTVDWQADDVQALEVLIGGFSRGVGRIFWAVEGEAFSEERSLVSRRTTAVDPERLVFDLTFHPQWRGRIQKLRIHFESIQDEPMFLREIRVARFRPVAEHVAASASRSWKIDIDHEARNGFLALPGIPIERSWPIPEEATFRVGFAMDPGARRPVRFKAVIDSDGRPVEPLLDFVVEPYPVDSAFSDPAIAGPLAHGQWHDQEINLSEFGGREATLRLTVEPADGSAEDYDLIQGLSYWADPQILAPTPSMAEKPLNVVLISIDTLRADHMSLHGYERATTPGLDRWAARRGTVFENAIATSPWTIPSHLSILTGLDAMHHGFNHSGIVPDRFQLMAEELRGVGYNTLAVTGGGFMHPTQGFGQGFDRYRYWPETQSADEIEDGVQRALGWIETVVDQPFFLFFHTYEVHWPYRRRAPYFAQYMGEEVAGSPEIYVGISDDQREPESGFLLSQKLFWKPEKKILERDQVTETELPEIIGRYDSGIAFADQQVAKLLERLEASDLGDRTVVLITSDHGEALGERGLGGHAYLDEFNLRVPLLISLPDGRGWGQRVNTQVRGTDVLPTVRELVGLEAPAVDGQSLIPLIEDPSASHPPEAWSYASFSNHGVALRVENRFKYLFNNTAWEPLPAREKFFDLRNDPREEHDLAESERDVEGLRRRVREQMDVWAASKLQVRFRNGLDYPITGRVRGSGIHPTIVKTPGLPAGSLTWVKLGMAAFRVLPGEEFTFYLERIEGRLLRFEIDGQEDEAAFGVDLDVEKLATDWQWALDGETWTASHVEDAASSDLTTGILVYQPLSAGEAEDLPPQTADPKVLEQLEALGYIP